MAGNGDACKYMILMFISVVSRLFQDRRRRRFSWSCFLSEVGDSVPLRFWPIQIFAANTNYITSDMVLSVVWTLAKCDWPKLIAHKLKVAEDRFCSSVCIYEKSMHEVRRLIPKIREMFTNRYRNASALVIARVKRCLVKKRYSVLKRIVLSA